MVSLIIVYTLLLSFCRRLDSPSRPLSPLVSIRTPLPVCPPLPRFSSVHRYFASCPLSMTGLRFSQDRQMPSSLRRNRDRREVEGKIRRRGDGRSSKQTASKTDKSAAEYNQEAQNQ